jgi:hypothetical protein
MTSATTRLTTRTADSTDRVPALSAAKTSAPAGTPKSAAARVGGAARRLLNALMRSLATPHV